MSQWNKNDAASNSVLWAPAKFSKTPNTTNRDNLYGNVTVDAFVTGAKVGQFGVDTTEVGVSGGPFTAGIVTSGGTGYGANAVVTLTFANGTTNASAVNSTAGSTGSDAGRITALTVNAAGSGYTISPAVSIAAPGTINITANSTGFSNTTDTLVVSSANSRWQVGDRLYYSVPTGNTPIAPLTGNTYYYVSFANTTTIAVSATKGGSNVDLTDDRVTVSGETHTIQGDTATGEVTVGGGRNKGIPHAGWVVRTEGTGGRAGRVQYEVLVAMGSITSDGSDDTILPDS